MTIGRGGMFVRFPDNHPIAGERVAINIRFASGDLLLLEGTGIVRWARREEAPDLPKGYGVEFECLGFETRRKILEFTRSVKLRPFIPRR